MTLDFAAKKSFQVRIILCNFVKKSALVIRRQAWLSPPRRYMARANAAIAMLAQLLRVEFASLISFNQGVRND
ncbi:MAG TPA: hypothetical protein PLD80_02370 [Rugosibacter sp.]|nr:hypothetical protein [Rugosibacter sp.]HQN46000.1 hypothetical protein [Rugosibacter sp.]